MRYLIFALAFLTVPLIHAQAQDNVPSAVRTAFSARFSKAKDVRWDMEDKTTYEAEFTMGGTAMSALFDRKGTWKETETRIGKDALPSAVTATIAKDFQGYEMEEIQRIDNSKNEVSYEVEFEKGDRSMEVVFDANGHVLKRKTEPEKDENNEEEND